MLDLSRLLRRHVPWPGAKCPRPWREKVRVKESSPPEGRHPHPNVLLSGEKVFPSRAIAFGIFQPSKWQSRRSGGGRNPEISGVSQHSLDKATWIPAFPGMTGTSKAKCDNPGLPRHPLMPFIPDLHVPCMYRRVRTIAKSFHAVESAPTRLSRESRNPQFQPWSPAIFEADGANRTTLQSS